MNTFARLALPPLLIFVLIVSPITRADDIVIGTGSKSGVYYQVGRAICRLIDTGAQGLSCETLETAGSLFNLTNVSRGAIEIGIVQSDWQFHAVNQSGPFEFADEKLDNLRALFSVHGEPFTVVVRDDSGISSFDELKGRRVNIGNPGSGQRATMEVVMKAKGWTKEDFQLAEELPASQQSLALCHNKVQVMVYTVDHPNPSVGKAAALCDARVIDVVGPAIEKLVASHPYYAFTTIPGGIYEGTPDPVRTFGVKATVMTSSDVSEEVVYSVVKAVFDNLVQFRKMHPAFAGLEPSQMVQDGLTAPLHKGAIRYFEERGLM